MENCKSKTVALLSTTPTVVLVRVMTLGSLPMEAQLVEFMAQYSFSKLQAMEAH
jgi:hypothetical protein